MTKSFGSLVFTPVVKALEERYGSRRQYARIEQLGARQVASDLRSKSIYASATPFTWPASARPAGLISSIEEDQKAS